MKQLKLMLLLLAAWMPYHTMAEVQAVNILTGRGEGAPSGAPTRYVVPAGKVFIVESVQYYPPAGSEPTELVVQVNQRPLNFDVSRFNFINVGAFTRFKLYAFEKPIRLSAGEAVDSNSIRGYYIWRGLLVDTSDLFANLNVDLRNPRIEGGKLVADAKVSSPRQHRLSVESSQDLESFADDSSAVVTPGASNSESTLAVNLDPSGKKFVRASATARPKQG